MSTILVIILLVIILVQFVQRMKFVRGFKNIPGPSSIPIFGNALQLTGSQAEFFKLMRRCSIKYGTMFRLWIGQRPFVFINKAEAIQPLLSSSEHLEKSLEYKLLHPFLGTGLITSTGKKWQSQRKLLTPVFHYEILENYLQPVLKGSSILVKKLEKEIGRGSFDIVPYTKLAALDIICELTLGYELNAQVESNHEYVKAIEDLMAIQQRRFITPWLKPNILFNCSSYAIRQKHCLDILNGFSTKVIRKKKQEKQENSKSENHLVNNTQKKRGKVFLDLLLELSENGSVLSDDDVRDQVNSFIFAGHDTTSIAVSWSLYVLGLHPEVQEKIYAEIQLRLPDFGNTPLKMADITRLEYLECCIKEVLRLYPPVPLIARQMTKSLNIMGQTIPAGTSALVNLYSLHRDPENFADPDVFNPERFLRGETKDKNPYCYVPFSAGPRNCIGQRLAIQMVKIVLADIIKNYKIRTIEKEENLKLVAEIVLVNEDGIKISVDRR